MTFKEKIVSDLKVIVSISKKTPLELFKLSALFRLLAVIIGEFLGCLFFFPKAVRICIWGLFELENERRDFGISIYGSFYITRS